MFSYQQYTKRLNLFDTLVRASYPELFLLWIFISALYTAVYFVLALTHPEHAPTFTIGTNIHELLFDSLYFSLTTGTTTGYGDIVPQGASKMIAMAQAILSILVFTALVGKIVGHRQDQTLHEVHRMSFEGVFYHIRNVLFIVRKDFDAIISKIRDEGTLDANDWDTLTTAYLQAHSLIEEIPELYGGHGFDLHDVDITREKLLFEALHRTLSRMQTLVMVMDQAGVDFRSHAASHREMRTLLDHIDGIMPLWRERSPFHEEDAFEDIRALSATLHGELKAKVR
jgi:hypothetical protein